jgi:hypothetical protein
MSLSDTDNCFSLPPFSSIDHFCEVAAKPAGIHRRYSYGNPPRAGRAHEVSDHDAQNQTGGRNGRKGDYQKQRSHRE